MAQKELQNRVAQNSGKNDLQTSHPSINLGVKLDMCSTFEQPAVKISGLQICLSQLYSQNFNEILVIGNH